MYGYHGVFDDAAMATTNRWLPDGDKGPYDEEVQRAANIKVTGCLVAVK